MRFDGDYDEDFPGQWELWEANLQRAMSGERGQQALRDLEQALLELPEKKLIPGNLAQKGQVCAVGALVVHRRVAAGEDRQQVITMLERLVPDEDEYCDSWASEEATLLQAKAVGVTVPLAVTLSHLNDDFYKTTPRERYELVLAWVRRRLISEPVAV